MSSRRAIVPPTRPSPTPSRPRVAVADRIVRNPRWIGVSRGAGGQARRVAGERRDIDLRSFFRAGWASLCGIVLFEELDQISS